MLRFMRVVLTECHTESIFDEVFFAYRFFLFLFILFVLICFLLLEIIYFHLFSLKTIFFISSYVRKVFLGSV